MFTKKTVKDIDISGKRVLLSVDYNVPGDADGNVTSDERIEASLPTLQYLISKRCSIILVSHRDRPGGKVVKRFSLEPVSRILSKLLDQEVQFIDDCIGGRVVKAKQSLQPGQILLLENTRFYPGEEANDKDFAKQLAEHTDVFVQDAFGNAHRTHATTDSVTRYLPSVAGLLLEKEVDTITNVMESPQRPLMAIIGGAKISDKLDIINRFIDIADFVAVGGAMANTFLLASGMDVAKSKVDRDDVPLAKEIMERAREKSKQQHFVFYLPQDGVVASKLDKTAKTRIVDWDAHVIASVENYPNRPPRESRHIADDEMILDIGPFSGAFMAGGMQLANTVIWNGAMGVTETDGLQGPVGPFAHGTELIVDSMLGQYGHRPFSVVGGGDTVGYLEDRQLVKGFNHVSTGGGASMELMSGKLLPGVEALMDKG